MGNAGYQTIKVRTETYDRLHRLLAVVARDGWSAIGAGRSTPVTISDLVAEAVARMETDGLSRRQAERT